jgi:hypothetical protein
VENLLRLAPEFLDIGLDKKPQMSSLLSILMLSPTLEVETKEARRGEEEGGQETAAGVNPG